jgi:hypothetical protein
MQLTKEKARKSNRRKPVAAMDHHEAVDAWPDAKISD